MLYIGNRLVRPVIFLEIFVTSYGATIIGSAACAERSRSIALLYVLKLYAASQALQLSISFCFDAVLYFFS
jgi:hypothetical protein